MPYYRMREKPDCWLIRCPVTGMMRIPRDGRWKFNGNYERPTFKPSINETSGKEGQTLEELRADPNPDRNHVVIEDGKIQYCNDCTHALAGQTVEIAPLSYAEMRRYWPDVPVEK
ncbi:MAG TPA: DUF6527 family protein [Chthonomonadaceae bacterium]|nr:DUF6527 family protein [Chthonomonadaceae bacterium]